MLLQGTDLLLGNLFKDITMKATYTLLPDFSTSKKPFSVKETIRSRFDTDFHFHHECQLVYVASGSGTRVIGDSSEKFEVGDLTFIGSNLPHVWYSNNSELTDSALSRSIALYINPVALVEILGVLEDVSPLERFFKESERGIRVDGPKKELITNLLKDMTHQNGVALISNFLQILSLLVDDEQDIVYLNEPSLIDSFSVRPQGRVSKLMEYIHHNFRTEITLEGAASVVDLQVHSFCRYFKTLTNRTFTDFLNEVRVGNACKLLHNYDMSIAQVAFDSGFSNISYFNRTFKKLRGITPRAYRIKEQSKNQMSGGSL